MSADSFPCRNCQSGIVRLRHVTYFTWLRNELITVPNFPAWVCDVCGKREYDQRAISWLTMLLNPYTGKAPMPAEKSTRVKTQKDPQPPQKITQKEKR